jgi:hypothetical protein
MPDDRPLPDGALVVRGGVMHPRATLEAARDALAVMGTPAVSVFAGDAATVSVEDLVDMGPIPHASICISTVGRLRAAGFVIRRTGRYPHCSVELGARPSIAAATRLTTAFDGPVPNPRTRSQR